MSQLPLCEEREKYMKIIKSSKQIKADLTPKRVRDWVAAQEQIRADSLFDDDGIFTRDDEIEYIEQPLEDMIRQESTWNVSPEDIVNLRAYIDDKNKLEVDCDLLDYSFTVSTQIDLRRIRVPSDLKKYASVLFNKIKEELSDSVEGCDNITAGEMLSGDREFNSRPLKDLKKGAWFTLKPIAEPAESQVWVKGDYDRIDKEFCCHSLDDINRERFFKATRLVYDDNNFEI